MQLHRMVTQGLLVGLSKITQFRRHLPINSRALFGNNDAIPDRHIVGDEV